MDPRRRLVLIAVVVAVLIPVGIIVATSGSKQSNPASGNGTSRAEFISKADAVCKKWGQPGSALAKQLNLPPVTAYYSNLRVLIGQAEARGQGQLRLLHGLAVPSGDEATIGRLLTAAQQVLSDTHNLWAAVASRQVAQIEVTEGILKNAQAEYRGLAHAYGLTVCGQ